MSMCLPTSVRKNKQTTCSHIYRISKNLGRLKRHSVTKSQRIHSQRWCLSLTIDKMDDYRLSVCIFCGQGFSSSIQRARHERLHTGGRPYPCSKMQGAAKSASKRCRKRFTRLDSLTRHKLTHTDELRHACDQCDRRFTTTSGLNYHKRTHTDKRPHACEICGLIFAKSSTFMIHQRTHTGERLHACDICGSTFAQKGNLVTHQRTHTGERPYVCEICASTFAHQAIDDVSESIWAGSGASAISCRRTCNFN